VTKKRATANHTRDDPTFVRYVEWFPLSDHNNFLCDPLILVVILALRNGQAGPAKDVSEFLVAMRHNTQAIWTRPDEPVLPALRTENTLGRIDWSIPAPSKQIGNTIREFGANAGADFDLVSHDLRRGVAKDLKQVAAARAGVLPAVGSALGHSSAAFNAGTTALYAERESIGLLNAREASVKPSPFSLTFSKVPGRVRVRPGSVKALQAVDPNLTYHTARKRARKAEREVQGEKRARVELEQDSSTTLSRRPTEIGDVLDAIVKGPSLVPAVHSASDRNTSTAELELEYDKHSDQLVELEDRPGLLFPDAESVLDDGESSPSVDISLIDPELLSASAGEDLTALITQCEREESPTSAPAEDFILNDDETSLLVEAAIPTQVDYLPDGDSDQPLTNRLIDYFSSINIVRSDSRNRIGPNIASGNSRNAPTVFLHDCTFAIHGCTKAHHNKQVVERHEVECDFRNGTPEVMPPARVLCDPGCGRDFKSANVLRSHHQECDAWQNRQPTPAELEVQSRKRECSDCGNSVVNMAKHRKKFCKGVRPQGPAVDDATTSNNVEVTPVVVGKPAYVPRHCNKGCNPPAWLTSKVEERKHSKRHRILSYVPKQCPLSDECKHKKEFASKGSLKRHLATQNLHTLTKDEVDAYLATSDEQDRSVRAEDDGA